MDPHFIQVCTESMEEGMAIKYTGTSSVHGKRNITDDIESGKKVSCK